MEPEYVTTAEMASILRVCPETIRRMAREPGCPVERVGRGRGHYRFPKAEFLAWVRERSAQWHAPVITLPTRAEAIRRLQRRTLLNPGGGSGGGAGRRDTDVATGRKRAINR